MWWWTETGTYLTDQEWTGVWLSNGEPFDGAYLARDITLLTIEIPEDVISESEWVEEGEASVRTFLAPASLINSYGPPVVTHG